MNSTAGMSGSQGARLDSPSQKKDQDVSASGFDAMLASQSTPTATQPTAAAAGLEKGSAPAQGENPTAGGQQMNADGKPVGAAAVLMKFLKSQAAGTPAKAAATTVSAATTQRDALQGLLSGTSSENVDPEAPTPVYTPPAPQHDAAQAQPAATEAKAAPAPLPVPPMLQAESVQSLRVAIESTFRGMDAASARNAAPSELETQFDEMTTPGRQVTRQVGAHLLRNLSALSGKGGLRLTLNPDTLGRVEITFERNGGDLKLTFRADGSAATQALREGAGDLQTLLLDRGGQWEKVSVKVEADGDEPQDEPDDRGGQRDEHAPHDESNEQEGSGT